jgi:hypothetical protein
MRMHDLFTSESVSIAVGGGSHLASAADPAVWSVLVRDGFITWPTWERPWRCTTSYPARTRPCSADEFIEFLTTNRSRAARRNQVR